MADGAEVWAIRSEIFSDGTSSHEQVLRKGLKDLPPDWVKEVGNRNKVPRKKIDANPGAAEVWQQERLNGAPWRERAERLQQIEDEKAMREQAHKRITLLAKQTCNGLKLKYNSHFDVAELIPLLKQAEKEADSRNHDKELQALFQAVLRYDLKSVCNLIKAYTVPKAPVPSLGISTRSEQAALIQYNLFLNRPPVPERISEKGLS